MFSQSARYYDLVYSSFKDYAAEAQRIAELIRQLHPTGNTVLDVACGTAEHARLLVERHGFDVTGLELDPAFVEIARRKLPAASIHHGDMTSFRLAQRFDIVLCLFSSIGYVRTIENVRRSLACFREHLADGGVILVEPWFTPDAFHPGRTHVITAEGDGVTVCRMSQSSAEAGMSRLYFEYLIGRESGIERASEVHELGLFTVSEMSDAFAAAGLRCDYDPVGLTDRGLYVARVA